MQWKHPIMKMHFVLLWSSLALLPQLLFISVFSIAARKWAQLRAHTRAWLWAIVPTLVFHFFFFILSVMYDGGWGIAGIYLVVFMVGIMSCAGPIFGFLFSSTLWLKYRHDPAMVTVVNGAPTQQLRSLLHRATFVTMALLIIIDFPAFLLLVDFEFIIFNAVVVCLVLVVTLLNLFAPQAKH